MPGTLKCPKGHEAESWVIHDRVKGRVVSKAEAEVGEVAMMNKSMKLPPIASDRRAQAAFDEHVGRQLAAATVAHAAPASQKKARRESLARAAFVDGTGLKLFLWLRNEPDKFGSDPFRIRWRLKDPRVKKGNGQTGVVFTAANESAGRDRFRECVEATIKAGWKEKPAVQGSTKLVLRPIPAPKKRAS